jgi:putative membrane protein
MKKPVVIELDGTRKKTAAHPTPADVPAVPELETGAVQAMTRMAARKPPWWGRLFIWVAVTLAGFVISVMFWDFVANMMVRNIWLGRVALILTGLFVFAVLAFVIRELAAFARLRRIDGLRRASDAASASADMPAANRYCDQISRFYAGRQDLRWAFARLSDLDQDILDADARMALVEQTIVSELDKQAEQVIEAASRQVATATALIPLALADVAVALGANIRMIRSIAQIYGGRSGLFGSWRLLRAVAAHLVATGAVAIGDDMISSIAGGSVVSKLSRRFGEGIINGALTARVGVAAMDVCRPMRFRAVKKPSVTGIMKRALTGFIGKSG